jgi:broad specificity phosphatase PhoE
MRPLLVIRHAQSVMNAEGRWQGQADPPLSEAGRTQAKVLARALRESECGARLARLVTSDLKRAAETAAIVGAALGIEPELCAELRETDVGSWSGLLHGEIEQRHGDNLALWRTGDEHVRPGGGESRTMVRERAASALLRLRSEGEGAIAVVTHLGVLRTLRPGTDLANAEFLWWEEASSGSSAETEEVRAL